MTASFTRRRRRLKRHAVAVGLALLAGPVLGQTTTLRLEWPVFIVGDGCHSVRAHSHCASSISPPPSLTLAAQSSSPFKLTQVQMPSSLPRPAVVDLAPVAPRTISPTTRSLGGVSGLTLGDTSVSVRLPLATSDLQALRAAVAAALSPPAQSAPHTARSVKVVLDKLQLLGAGAKGGYFYKIYINLPPSGEAMGDSQQYFLGTLGPFEIAGASRRGSASLEFPATEVLSRLSPSGLQEVILSFERLSGENAPREPVLRIGEVRIEVSTDAPWENSR